MTIEAISQPVQEEPPRIDWDRAALDSAAVPAPGGAKKKGKNPTDPATAHCPLRHRAQLGRYRWVVERTLS